MNSFFCSCDPKANFISLIHFQIRYWCEKYAKIKKNMLNNYICADFPLKKSAFRMGLTIYVSNGLKIWPFNIFYLWKKNRDAIGILRYGFISIGIKLNKRAKGVLSRGWVLEIFCCKQSGWSLYENSRFHSWNVMCSCIVRAN